jgi:hypothetical protein
MFKKSSLTLEGDASAKSSGSFTNKPIARLENLECIEENESHLVGNMTVSQNNSVSLPSQDLTSKADQSISKAF